MANIEFPTNPAVDRVLEAFQLTTEQRSAAAARGQDILVTAGAGSGKTRTLVARYISLLAEGLSPRRVVAITFTEKAAREMRNRVRVALTEQVTLAVSADERRRWIELNAQMDAARIGTIHSLCAEILRAYPAEAGIDPRFEVLEEGLVAALRAQVVQDTLSWLVGMPEFSRLLVGLKTSGLQRLLAYLLNNRLETQAAFETSLDAQTILRQTLQDGMRQPALLEPLVELLDLQASGKLREDAGDRLAEQISELLLLWNQAEQFLAGNDWIDAASLIFAARRQWMGGGAGRKESRAKATLAELKNAYDQRLDPWLGGKNAKDQPPSKEIEALFRQVLPLVRLAFEHLQQGYLVALRQRQALDFDDLEAGAARLLARLDLRQHWQGELDALLVDEFQDTNARQREIVLALCGKTPGRLFVVGDARQSIYRFRRADVTVFRDLQRDIQRRGGLVVDLDLTFRAHAPLLQAAGDLLAVAMGEQPDPERPFFVPFTPLRAHRELPPPNVGAPYVEFVLGAGEDADSARPAAARALAQRLSELHQAGEIQRWDDVALLFRASTGFPFYENALEETGIPFVTVAGQGFYNRPEIRDVLNLLRALADPWDDLVMAGLLRSPAFGLSDAALYHLRQPGNTPRPFWGALQSDLTSLDETDQAYARRVVALLSELRPLVDRLPVVELLKLLVDRVDYRAILASADASVLPTGTSGRLWRNLDKLINDAQVSGLVNVRTFLEYLDTLRDVGAREGEAPAEAEGAVRLMTIHKAKGLEFPFVVLADAARQLRNTGEPAYLLLETGLAFRLDRVEAMPLLYRLANFQERLQTEAEEKRLLYVALTRAKEKLFISGHCTPMKSGDWRANGWLSDLAAAGQVNLSAAVDNQGVPLVVDTSGKHPLRIWALPQGSLATIKENAPRELDWPDSAEKALYGSLSIPQPEVVDPELAEMARPWRATGERLRPPAEAVGRLVHRAIQRWLFPGDPALPGFLETVALEAGLADPAQRAEALRHTEILLERLRQHPLWQEIERAEERYHEVAYTRSRADRRQDAGFIDLLYHNHEGWQILDFKTDALHSVVERQNSLLRYQPQMRRYARAALDLLREPARLRLCFLDDMGRVSLHEVRPNW